MNIVRKEILMSASARRNGRIARAAAFGVIAGSISSFGITPLIAFAEPAILTTAEDNGIYTDQNFKYVLDKNGNATIIGLADKGESELDIPAQLDGHTVTRIGGEAFMGDLSLISVEMPDSVLAIGEDSFTGCRNLRSVVLSANLTSIGRRCFANSGIEKLDLPETLASIPYGAFEDCTKLKEIRLPDSIEEIGESAFQGCTNAAAILLPSNIRELSRYSFAECESIKSIQLPPTLTAINGYVFKDCTSLTSVSIPSGVTYVGTGAFEDCSSLRHVSLPASVISVDTNAFKSISYASTITVQTQHQLDLLTNGDSIEEERTTVEFEEGYPVAVASVTLDSTALTLNLNASTQLTATVTPSNADGQVTWTSSNPSVATVNNEGRVTGRAIGTTQIIATAGGKSAVCNVTVAKMESRTIGQFDGEQTATASMKSGADDRWVVENPSILTLTEVSSMDISWSGKKSTATFVPKQAGTTILRCYADDVVVYALVVTVTPGQKTSIVGATISGLEESYELSDDPVTPKPTVTLNGTTLAEGTDYTLSYKDNDKAGTATVIVTGAGKYEGTVRATFKIVEVQNDLKDSTIAGIDAQYEWEGKAIEPKPTVTVDGKALTEGTDYTLAYKNNNAIGTATITITAKGDYKGTKTLTFEIVDEVRDLKDAVITGLQESYVYEGSPIEPKPTVTLGGKTLKEGTDYTLSYSDNDAVGTATIIITSAGDYQGICTVTFKIVEKQVEIEFTDVAPEAWYHDPVYAAAANGYMNGYAGTTLFGPENNITRGQVACVLYNMANGELGAQSYSGYSFPDVNQSEYYADAIAWAKASGVVNGYGDGTFRPEAYVSAEEFAAMLANYAQLSGRYSTVDTDAILAQFGDGGQVSDWARNVVAWAVSEHVIGNGGFLDPTGAVARGRVAAMAVNFQPEAL